MKNNEWRQYTQTDFASVAAGLPQVSRLGVYIHVPFCPHICPYCDFVKTSVFNRKDLNRYVAGVVQQWQSLVHLVPANITNATLYFGGGTPSLLPIADLEMLVKMVADRFELEEITIESNPFSNGKSVFEKLKSVGFQRLTLGVQSLCPDTLVLLGRKHTPKQAIENIGWAHEAGFKNIQVDLIYGLCRNLRTTKIEDEVRAIVEAGATGISGYALTIEERTKFKGRTVTDDDKASEEYFQLVEICAALGLGQIETSNFSKFPAMHNNIYWHGLPYLGLGTGAHGLLPPTPDAVFGKRYKVGNHHKVHSLGDDVLAFDSEFEALFNMVYEPMRSKQDAVQELIMTLLRTANGVPILWLDQALGSDWKSKLTPKLIEAFCFEYSGFSEGEVMTLRFEKKIFLDYWTFELLAVLFGT